MSIFATVSLLLLASQPKVDDAAIDRFVNAYCERTLTPGMIVVVTQGTRPLLVSGYGHDSGGKPITPDSPMPIASLSKSFTAFAIMQLVDSGKIQLDGRVHGYLPEFSMADERAHSITVRQLLSHTSGMSDATFPEKSLPQPRSLEEAVSRLRNTRLADDPGARFHYHNPNYQVAARLVEVVSGERFADYMRDHIFLPMGMAHTRTIARLDVGPALPRGYARFYGVPIALPEPYWYLDGSSGIVTTARDMACWLIMQNNDGVCENGTRLISPESFALMRQPSAGTRDKGLGWSIGDDGGHEILFHTGWMFTYSGKQIILPDTGYGIAVVANTGIGLSAPDSDTVAEGIVQLTNGKAPAIGMPVAIVIGAVLAALSVTAFACGILGVIRAKDWSRKRKNRPRWRMGAVLSIYLVPMVLLLNLRSILGYVFGGRDATWVQLFYGAGPVVILLAIAAGMGFAIIYARVSGLRAADRA